MTTTTMTVLLDLALKGSLPLGASWLAFLKGAATINSRTYREEVYDMLPAEDRPGTSR
jgi:hypothetical protein